MFDAELYMIYFHNISMIVTCTLILYNSIKLSKLLQDTQAEIHSEIFIYSNILKILLAYGAIKYFKNLNQEQPW